MKINIPVSIAELFDKCSILNIKLHKCPNNSEKYQNILTELTEIDSIRQDIIGFKNHLELVNKYKELLNINEKIWEIEDKIRLKEKNKNFDNEFIVLARNVYLFNDLRAQIKKEINIITNSYIVEEKIYESY